MRHLIALILAVILAACGGTDPLQEAFALAVDPPDECVSQADYAALSSSFALRPDLDEGELWHPPFILRPATPASTAPNEVRPGFVGTPVVVFGPQGQPMTMHGPYYVPGELPPFVCATPGTV